jgi:hypothetical protein
LNQEAANQAKPKRSVLIDIDPEFPRDGEDGTSSSHHKYGTKEKGRKSEEDDSLPPEKKIKNSLPHKMANNSRKDAGSGLKTKRLAPLSAIEKEKALRRAYAFKSENPFFVIAIQPAYVCSGANMVYFQNRAVHQPAQVARAHFFCLNLDRYRKKLRESCLPFCSRLYIFGSHSFYWNNGIFLYVLLLSFN